MSFYIKSRCTVIKGVAYITGALWAKRGERGILLEPGYKRGCFETWPIKAKNRIKMSGIKIVFAMHLVKIDCVGLQYHHKLEIKMI